MSKIKIKMKITGFELEIEGSRDDVPNVSRAIGRQLSGLMQSPDTLLSSATGAPAPLIAAEVEDVSEVPARKKAVRRRRTGASANAEVVDAEISVDWRAALPNYGAPSQSWNTAMKSLWTLYVASQLAGVKEMTGRQIASQFNTHFRQAKAVTVTNVNRDLGRMKVKSPAPVGDDASKSPPAWYLTQEGVKVVQAAIAELASKASGS